MPRLSGRTVALIGLDDVDSYFDALDLLREAGYVVVSPGEFCDDDADALRETLEGVAEAVLVSDVLVTLPGWEGWPGCRTLVQFAALLGKPVLELHEALRPHVPEDLDRHRWKMIGGGIAATSAAILTGWCVVGEQILAAFTAGTPVV